MKDNNKKNIYIYRKHQGVPRGWGTPLSNKKKIFFIKIMVIIPDFLINIFTKINGTHYNKYEY